MSAKELTPTALEESTARFQRIIAKASTADSTAQDLVAQLGA